MRTPIQQKVKHGKTRQNGSRKTTALDLRGMQQKFFGSQRSHCPWGLGSQRSQTFWLSLLRLQMCPKKEHVSFVYSLKLFVCNRGKITDLTGSIQGSYSNPPIQDVRFRVNYMIKMFHLPHSFLLIFPASREAKRMSLKITKTGIIIRIIAYCEIWKYYPEIYYQESHLDLLVNNY